MTVLAIAAVAAALAADAPKPEVRNVRISSPRLVVSRANAKSEAVASGQFHVEMSCARQTVKKPVVRLAALCEVDGAISLHSVFLDSPRTFNAMKRADVMAAFKSAGIDVPSKDRASVYSDPARFTPLLPEVSREYCSTAVYGTAEINKGFFRLGRSPVTPKILVWRIEIWQNGSMVATWESSKAGLGKYALPADWHVWKKYPAKFRYVDSH